MASDYTFTTIFFENLILGKKLQQSICGNFPKGTIFKVLLVGGSFRGDFLECNCPRRVFEGANCWGQFSGAIFWWLTFQMGVFWEDIFQGTVFRTPYVCFCFLFPTFISKSPHCISNTSCDIRRRKVVYDNISWFPILTKSGFLSEIF